MIRRDNQLSTLMKRRFQVKPASLLITIGLFFFAPLVSPTRVCLVSMDLILIGEPAGSI